VGRFDEAEALLRHAVETRRRVLGDHADTATAMTVLAQLHNDRGELAPARELLLEALEMRLRVLGPESPAVGDSNARLGRLALLEGDPVRAESFLRAAQSNLAAAIGAEHPDVTAVHYRLGQALHAQGRFEEAREELELALALQEREFGVDSPITSDTRDEWHRLLLAQADFEGALEALDTALTRAVNQVGPIRAYLNGLRGAASTGLGRYEEAEPLLLEAWRVMGPDERLWPVNKLAVLDALVEFYVAIEDEGEAARYRALADALR